MGLKTSIFFRSNPCSPVLSVVKISCLFVPCLVGGYAAPCFALKFVLSRYVNSGTENYLVGANVARRSTCLNLLFFASVGFPVTVHYPIAEHFIGQLNGSGIDDEIRLAGVLGNELQAKMKIFKPICA